MATGAFSTSLLCKLECSTSARPCRPVSSHASNCHAVRFPFLSCDPSFLGSHHYDDVTAVRRVANTNEQSGDFVPLKTCRKYRGSNAHGFAKGRRVLPMALVSWSPERSLHNETRCYEDVFKRVCGEVEADFNTLTVRSPWLLFQPQKFAFPKGGRWRSGVRRVVDHLIQSAQPGVHSSEVYYSQRGFSKSSRNGDQAGHGRGIVNAVGTDAGTSSSGSQVHCQVEAVSWRERHIGASVGIEATQERVWEVLTDYGRLAEFIPNLTRRCGA